MCDLFDEEVFEKKLRRVADGYKKRFGDLLQYDVEEEIARYKARTPDLDLYSVRRMLTLLSRNSAPRSLLTSSTRSLSSSQPRRRTLRF